MSVVVPQGGVPSPSPPGRLRRATGGRAWAWLLVAAITTVATVLYAGIAAGMNPLASPFHLPWFVLAPLFYVTECHVVHVEWRNEAHTFSLGELPMIVALFFGGPEAFVLAQVTGAAAAFVLRRRQSPVKACFNVAHYGLEAVVAAIVFFTVIGDGAATGMRGWTATLLAAGASALLGELLVGVAVYVAEGRISVRDVAGGMRTGLLVTWTNTSLGLVAVILLWRDPEAAWLLLVPAAVLVLAYRAYADERQKQKRLELLRRSTRTTITAAGIERALRELLDHAREMFRSGTAEMTLVPDAPGEPPLVTSAGPAGFRFMQPWEAARHALSEMPADAEARLLDPVDPAGVLLDGSARDGMVAPILDGPRVVGRLVVADRLGEVSTFGAEDVRLFETLAQHLSVSLSRGKLEETLAEVTDLHDELEHRALHDALTGLPNRALLETRLEEAIAAGDEFGVLGIDLDGFKAVNDTEGHAAGDAVLVTVGERLGAALRPTDTVARLGGDEFVVLLRHVNDLSDVETVAQRIIDDLVQPISIDGKDAFVGASVGIVVGTGGETAHSLLEQADAAMYAAKSSGKGRFVVFETTMVAARERRNRLKADLERALRDGELFLQYQPLIDMSGGRVCGAEALIRWRHPELGLVAPAEFLGVAEESGLMVALGEWVLEEACRRLAAWRGASGDTAPDRINVNLTRRQLLQPGLPATVKDVVQAAGLEPGSLVLEINESVLSEDAEATTLRLEDLRRAGASIAIDDFGIGYSSITYLTRFPIDTLKVHQSFVRGVHDDPEKSALARAIVGLADALGLDTVAQGIESPEDMLHLREIGCRMGQGYLFARPLDADAFEAFFVGHAAWVDGPRSAREEPHGAASAAGRGQSSDSSTCPCLK